MQSLREALGSASHGATNWDAAIVAATQDAIQQTLPDQARYARATSVRHGQVTVTVFHGALAGLLSMEHEKICQTANQLLAQRFPERRLTVERLISRVTS